MNPLWLLFGIALGFAAGYLFLSRKHASKYLASAEYWVYLPDEAMPAQDRVMTRMLRESPVPGAIGPQEGLVFSDIRLHIAPMRRSQNPILFRPDFFADLDVDRTRLESLNDSQAVAKLRYLSEEPLKDKRHLQFLAHAAEAYAALSGARLIYDLTAERLYETEEFRDVLRSHRDATRPEVHTKVTWKSGAEGGFAETKGLRKVGRDDLKTDHLAADQKLLALNVLEEAVRRIWSQPDDASEIEVDAFDDRFRVVMPERKGEPVRILRIQTT